jgi:hypothetical protein
MPWSTNHGTQGLTELVYDNNSSRRVGWTIVANEDWGVARGSIGSPSLLDVKEVLSKTPELDCRTRSKTREYRSHTTIQGCVVTYHDRATSGVILAESQGIDGPGTAPSYVCLVEIARCAIILKTVSNRLPEGIGHFT